MRQLLFGIGLLLTSYSALAQAEIKATVLDAKTKEPIAFTTVQLLQNEAVIQEKRSDERGLVLFRDVSIGNYTVQCQSFAFESQSQSIAINASGVQQVVFELTSSVQLLQAVDITGIKASADNPIAFTEMTKADISKVNEGRDIPFILEQTPGLVTTSDAGAGIGYTSMRIRGSDQTRINVTINGVPVNDAESQGVFWVNMPDLASSLQNIQVQRGLGTSTNGAGAFGASVHMETDALSDKAYSSVDVFGGSFNTLRTNLRFGTGNIGHGVTIEGRLSRIVSDGYIERAASDLQSYYFAVGKASKNTSLKFITFGGRERTYQSWYGIDSETFQNNPRFNPAGEITRVNASGELVTAGFYPDQVDNYRQDHYQLHLNHNFNSRWKLHAAAHYTFGTGYYEEYRNAHRFSNYGLPSFITADSVTVNRSDLTRRLWLRNHFYGGIYNLQYTSRNTNLVIGGGANYYTNDHFGEVLWVEELPELEPFEFYNNVGQKLDANQYIKVTQTLAEQVSIYGDLQVRYVDYRANGLDRNLSDIDVSAQLLFFNPKAGLLWRANTHSSFFASVGYGGREPARRDFLEAQGDMPRPEFLLDYEAGWRWVKKDFHLEVNAYYMDYFDQLVLTGELSDVGFPLRQNVGRSYRTGIEIHGGYLFTPKWKLEGNLALSRNRNIDWQETLFDENWNEEIVAFGNTTTAFSPSIVAGSVLSYSPVSSFTIAWSNRFVGKQYVTNTQIDELSLPSYWINDLRFRYSVTDNFRLSLFVNNIFGNDLFFGWLSEQYASNGYGWSELVNGTPSAHNLFVFPQATTNFLLGLSINL